MSVRGVIFASGIDRSDAINAAAEKYGLPARIITAGAIMESDLTETAARLGDWPDVSFGPFQQTVAYAPIGDQSASAENIALVRRTLTTQFDYALEIAARQYAGYWRQYGDPLEVLSRYNGGPGMAYADNPNAAHIRDSWARSAQYEASDAPALVYNPDQPPERQIADWVCSIRTATWMVRSIGLALDAGRMEDLMVNANLVDAAVGLHDGTGGALAAFLETLTGCVTAAYQSVSWAWLQAHAGTGPIGMGSGTLDHWLAVRRVNDDGTLALANPAPAWQGVGDVMDEASFQRWAPWNCVAVTLPTPPEEDDLSAAERAELEQLRAVKVYCDTLTGSILPSALGTIEDAAKGGKGVKWQKVREQCAAVRTQAGI